MLIYDLTNISGPVIITTDGLTGEVTIVPEFQAVVVPEVLAVVVPEVLAVTEQEVSCMSYADLHAAMNYRQLTQCERDSIDMSYLIDRAYRANGEI